MIKRLLTGATREGRRWGPSTGNPGWLILIWFRAKSAEHPGPVLSQCLPARPKKGLHAAVEGFVRQPAVLVTSDGRRVLPEGDQFFAGLAQLAPDPIAFAIRNLGFVKFQPLDERVTLIELHPGAVGRRALLAAERRIAESGGTLFRLSYLDAGRPSRSALTANDAIGRLRELRAPPAASAVSRFRVEPQDYANLLRDADNPLRLLSQKWCESFGEFGSEVTPFAAKIGVLPRLMIIGLRPRVADPVFRFIGDGHDWLTQWYASSPIGERVEDLPDREYGAWASRYYKSVARSGEPRYDLVTAALGRGTETPYRVHYERLMLPWKTSSNEVFVTMVSKVLRRDAEGEEPATP
jgi:hypothetical protein